MNKKIPKKVNILRSINKPLVCGIICGFSAFITHSLLESKVNGTLNVMFSTLSGVIVYLISLILAGVFRTNGIIKRKNTKKLKKPLAKSRKIG